MRERSKRRISENGETAQSVVGFNQDEFGDLSQMDLYEKELYGLYHANFDVHHRVLVELRLHCDP